MYVQTKDLDTLFASIDFDGSGSLSFNQTKFLDTLFASIDTDGSGSLSFNEVIAYPKTITDDFSDENVKIIFDGLDTSGNMKIDKEEFRVKILIFVNVIINK